MSLPTIQTAAFSCPRTCPKYEKRDLCRFNRLFAMAGVVTEVTSHTVSVAIEFKNLEALAIAVESLGGKVLGQGTHKLCSTSETGFGFRLPKWNLPLVVKADATLAYDNYNGRWGNVKDLDRLKVEYATGALKNAADRLGWQNEMMPNGSLIVYHPGGGTLTYTSDGQRDTVDANNFHGQGCHEATTLMAEALGKPVEYTAKPEFYERQQEQTQN